MVETIPLRCRRHRTRSSPCSQGRSPRLPVRSCPAAACQPRTSSFSSCLSPCGPMGVVIRFLPALHEEQQRQDGEGDHHHQLEIVEIGDEQCLPGDLRVDVGKRRRSRDGGERSPARSGSRPADCCWVMVRGHVGMRDLGHPNQLRADYRNSDRTADVARQVEQRRSSRPEARRRESRTRASATARRSARAQGPGRRR